MRDSDEILLQYSIIDFPFEKTAIMRKVRVKSTINSSGRIYLMASII